MRPLFRYLSLRPYGDSLLTPAAAFWIFAVRIAILLMAAAEAMAWSYAAFYLATGGARWAAGIGAFIFTFATVCLIDASLMTLDRWARKYDHRITLEEPPHRWDRLRDVLSIGTRVALIALSMYITAPFLAQLMFNDDIERALRDERTAIRANARQWLLDPPRVRAESLQKQLDERRAALDAEVAGGGLSGRYGDGVAARQIRATIETLTKEHASVVAEHQRLATEFDGMSDEALAARFNLALPGDSFQERARVLANIKGQNYVLTERAVQAFLGFLFFALILLKLFEPRSVKVYFSERLQGLWRQYQGGLFDAQLDPAERSNGSATMSPLRFEDWCLSTYGTIRGRDVDVARAGERLRFFQNSESELAAIAAAVAAEESGLIAELATLDAQLQLAIVDHATARRTVESSDTQLAAIRAQMTTLETGLKRPAAPAALSTIVSTIADLETSATSLEDGKAKAQQQLDALTPLLTDLQKRRADLASRVDTLMATKKQSESELAEARLRHMAELNRLMAARGSAAPAEAVTRFAGNTEPPDRIM